MDSPSGAAAILAFHFVKENMAALLGLLETPVIDLMATKKTAEKNGWVDIVLHMPSHLTAAGGYLAASMVVALVQLLWRRPTNRRCSVVGFFDSEGRLVGYPYLDSRYAHDAREAGYTTVVVPKCNAQQLLTSMAKDGGEEAFGIKVVGCSKMMEVVKYVILGQTPPR